MARVLDKGIKMRAIVDEKDVEGIGNILGMISRKYYGYDQNVTNWIELSKK